MHNYFLEIILRFLGEHYIVINFLGSLIGAEETVFILAMLGMQGYFPIWITYASCFFGFLISDIIWFSIGKTKAISFLAKKIKSKHLNKMKDILEKLTDKSVFKKLLFTKFFYGLRVPTIIYLTRKKISFKDFFYNDALVVFIWSIIIVSIGALAGTGLKIIMVLFRDFNLAMIYIIITSIIFIGGLELIKKTINKINDFMKRFNY